METPLPTWLFNSPFASYTIPQDIGADPGSLNGNTTLRNSASVILSNSAAMVSRPSRMFSATLPTQ